MLPNSTPLLVAAVMALSSCASPESSGDRAGRLYRQSQRTGFCAIHHVPLRRSTVYAFDVSRGLVHFGEAASAIAEKYPNVLDVSYSRTKSRDYPRATKEQFCPVCQDLFDAEIKSLKPTNNI